MVKSINVNDIDNIINDIELIDIREPFETIPKTLRLILLTFLWISYYLNQQSILIWTKNTI